MKKMYELSVETLTAIEAALVRNVNVRPYEFKMNVKMRKPLKGWGDELNIEVKNGTISAKCGEYELENEIDDVIYYFLGANGMWDISHITVE